MNRATPVMRSALLDGPGYVVLNILEALEDVVATFTIGVGDDLGVSLKQFERVEMLKNRFDNCFKVCIGRKMDRHELVSFMDDIKPEINDLALEVDEMSWVKDLCDAFYSELRL